MALTFSPELLGGSTSTPHDQHSEPAFHFIALVAMVIIYVAIIYMIIDFVTPEEEVEENWAASVMRNAASTGMSPAELEDQPYFIHGREEASMSCAVCLDGFKTGEVCRIFPLCRHTFHAHCIDPWLLRSRSCPTCRSPFPYRCRASLDNV